MAGNAERLIDVLTVIMLVVATSLGAVVLRDRFVEPEKRTDRQIDSWEMLAAEGHVLGDEDAGVTVLEWVDYQCPGCRSLGPRLDSLVQAYPEDVKVVIRHWPLGSHPRALPAAMAAECAADQGRFHEVHQLLLKEREWASSSPAEDQLVSLASRAGVADTSSFRSCVETSVHADQIDRDVAAVRSFEARGTPTVLVNGFYLRMVPQYEELTKLVEEALER